MSRNFISFISFLATASFFVSGCAVAVPELDKKLETMETPTQRSSRFDNSLERLGKLLEIYDIEPIAIQAKPIVNYSAGQSLPSNITVMVSTALANIGDRIVYLPYDPGYFSNEYATGGAQSIGRRLPDIVLNGGITEYDKDTDRVSSGGNLGIGFGQASGQGNFDASRSNSDSTSSIALDLQLYRYSDTSAIQGTQSSNSIKIYKQSKSNNLSFAILASGIGLNGSVDKTQGEHAAVRLLVEMSILETLGKYAKVPYWKCVEGLKPDKKVIQFHKDSFASKTDQQKIAIIQRQLRYLRYSGVTINGVLDDATKDALRRVLPNRNISIDEDLYVTLWENIDIDYAYQVAKKDKLAQKYAPKLGLNVENLKKAYKMGEKIELEISPTQKGYLYVFYDSSKDGFGQVYPNKFEKNNFFEASQKKKIPGHQSVILTAEGARVNEKLYFVYSLNDISPVINKVVGDKMNKNVTIQALISSIKSSNAQDGTYIVYGVDINKEK